MFKVSFISTDLENREIDNLIKILETLRHNSTITPQYPSALVPSPPLAETLYFANTANTSNHVASLDPEVDAMVDEAFQHHAEFKGSPFQSTDHLRPSRMDNIAAAADRVILPLDTTEVDSAGTPWNSEAHTGTKAKKADGTWKARRNSLAVVSHQATPQLSIPKPPTLAELIPATQTVAAPMFGDNKGIDFRTLMRRANEGLNAGSLTNAQIADVLVSVGLGADDLASLALVDNAVLVPIVYNNLFKHT